ncbi:MAG: hypothetical protein V1798_08810 [Pseudomonadota bacterium]
MRRLILLALLPVLAAFLSCGGKNYDFNRQLDRRINGDLEKRANLVKSNPLYFELVDRLAKGRRLLVAGQGSEAFLEFDKILTDTRFAKYPEYNYAKYYIACALYEMGVDYGALLYFVDIVRQEPLRLHTHESLGRAIKIAQKLKDDQLILFLSSSIEPEKVPRSLREEFRYFIAKEHYQRQQYDKASELLNSIPHINRLYLAALYLKGTIGVIKKDFRAAVKSFQEISNARSPVMYYEDHRIRQLANLALGRIFYEQRNYPLSIVYYKKVERDGEFFPLALYESTWALFKLNRFNEALAVLKSLNSPFYEQIYFLKSYLLKGAIDLELCNYQEAVGTLSTLETRFGGLKDEIDQFAGQARSPEEYYPLLSSMKRAPDGTKTFAYESLFRLAAANRDFLGVHRYIRTLQYEKDVLKGVPSSRSALLTQLINQKISELTLKASYLAGKKLLLTRQMIEDFQGLKDQVHLEIVTAERKILQKRALGLAPPVIPGQELISPKFTESLRETLVWWDYDGEYWKDELGYYLVDRKSRCKETEGGK